jgi:predicted peroxiredoxin
MRRLEYGKLEISMARRSFLSQAIALPFLGMSAWSEQTTHKPLKIMMKSAWGSDDPTKAAFPFLHGLALSEAGHSVQIFLLGEAVSVMRKSVAGAIVPVGWPPLAETLTKVVARRVAIYACGACCHARGVSEVDLSQWGAKFGNPKIFVSLVEWADRIITE